MKMLHSEQGGAVTGEREVERAVEAAAREEPGRASLWLSLAAQRRKLGMSARQLLKRSGAEMQALALLGVPDLRLDWLRRLSHAALLAQGAESWTGTLGGHRVHRYAFAGRGKDLPVLLLHGLGGSADSMATLVPPLLPISARIVLLELPGHGRSPVPHEGPLAAREYGDIVTAAVDRLYTEYGKVVLVGNSLGGALALYAAHERPDKVAGVVGLNPAGADLSNEALSVLPESFADERAGAARMAHLLFHRTPWLFWLVARDFARGWSSPTVQRILDDARHDRNRSLGIDVLSAIRAPVLILWGAEDRLLPSTSAEDFRRHIPGAQVELIPGCGHVPQLEQPAFTRRRVREFIEKLKT
ncbi:MAG TPA: alpha/beta hydrolase [Myxococcales bacterium]|nr:alpha/beta hydrolase [Myxococcales bacterium]